MEPWHKKVNMHDVVALLEDKSAKHFTSRVRSWILLWPDGCFFDLKGEGMRLDEKQRTLAMTLETGNV
jgi:hypothetical protein